jgi:4-hydroxy-tetrahydrodipicolinate synthase
MHALRLPLLLAVFVGLAPVARSQPHAEVEPAPAAVCAPCPWAGIYPTVLAPWNCHGGVDEAALAAQIRYQLQGGVHGLLVLGTVGEGEYACMAERVKIIRVAVQTTAGCVPVVVGIHTCNLDLARAQLLQAKELGAQAVLVKYVGHPHACFEDVMAFFQSLDQLRLLPIFYYHYPSQTELKLTPHEVAQILLLPGVVGIKESTLDLQETQAHIDLTFGHARAFLSGTGLNLTQFLAIGGHGAMCPEAALLPGLTVQVYQAFVQGDPHTARELQECLFVLAPLMTSGTVTETAARTLVMCAQDHHVRLPMRGDHPQARLKAALDCLGVPTLPAVKCPLPPLHWRDRLKVNQAVQKIRSSEHCPAGCGH